LGSVCKLREKRGLVASRPLGREWSQKEFPLLVLYLPLTYVPARTCLSCSRRVNASSACLTGMAMKSAAVLPQRPHDRPRTKTLWRNFKTGVGTNSAERSKKTMSSRPAMQVNWPAAKRPVERDACVAETSAGQAQLEDQVERDKRARAESGRQTQSAAPATKALTQLHLAQPMSESRAPAAT
jgi:hypothetical protein